jgi:hypothetical protein
MRYQLPLCLVLVFVRRCFSGYNKLFKDFLHGKQVEKYWPSLSGLEFLIGSI